MNVNRNVRVQVNRVPTIQAHTAVTVSVQGNNLLMASVQVSMEKFTMSDDFSYLTMYTSVLVFRAFYQSPANF